MQRQSWKEELDQIFGAYVRQETLETAANDMANISDAYPEMHDQFVLTLARAVEAAHAGDVEICRSIESSGYYCSDTAEAEKICGELLTLYQGRFARL
jgi:hypothetical protein